MTLEEAVKIFQSKFPDKKIIEGFEYDSLFVFSAINKNTKVGDGEFFDCQTSVDKKTKKLLTFQPWNISIEEYKRGKKVI